MTTSSSSSSPHRRPAGAGGASGPLSPGAVAKLREVFDRAQSLGFLGPADVEGQIRHALRFATAIGSSPTRALDLGSGAGLPGLVLAVLWPESTWVLLESMERRAEPLRAAVDLLELTGRVTVDARRAEVAGRDPALRGTMDVVTARSFGPPSVAVECGGAFLHVGGRLVVSDPPAGPGDRWPPAELAEVGLEIDQHIDGCTVLHGSKPFPDHLPRRTGMPAKRPRF